MSAAASPATRSTPQWLVPHFEKMLYDNALLLKLLALAHRETPSPLFAQRIDETVAWLLREMQHAEGGFAASLDADTDHEEGLTYVWTAPGTTEILGRGLPSFRKYLRYLRHRKLGRPDDPEPAFAAKPRMAR